MKELRRMSTLFVLALACLCSGTQAASNIRVANLRCEYLTEPLGVDVPHPRLSWNLASDLRGQKQSAYQILVASSPEILAQDIGDLWDSDKVASERTNHIQYQGEALQSDRVYYWKVRAWDADGEASAFSPLAVWTSGLLQASDWKAKWIGDPKRPEAPDGAASTQARPSPRFRTSFELEKPLKRATLFIAGLGYHETWINGQRVGDHVLDPAKTRYDKRVLYVAHNVTEQLAQGANAIGIQLGNGWYNMHARAVWNFDQAPWRASPRVLAQLNLTYRDGSTESIVTDQSWKTATGPFVFDSIRNGETYDARLETPGWNQPGFDSSSWRKADEVPAPGGKLRAQMMPPIRVTQTIRPVEMTEPEPGVYVFDLGQNIAGWVKLKLRGPSGTRITLRYSERLDARGQIDQTAIGKYLKSGQIQKDVYILKGEGIEKRKSHFSYHGFRYVEITGLTAAPKLHDLEGQVVHTDFETAGRFECSNPLINDIHRIALWSYRNNYHGYPTDCPQREKLGWSGDAHLAAEMGLFNFHQAASYSKWLDDWADEQKEDGSVPGIIPTSGWGYTWGNGPAWDSAFILIPWYLYLYYGDTQVLSKHYDGMKRYTDGMKKWVKEDPFILEYGLGDWCFAKTRTSNKLTSTGYYYANARILSQVADILGHSEEAQKYGELAAEIRTAFNKKFYQGDGTYGKGTQTGNSCAIFHGLAKEEAIQRVVANIVADVQTKDNHLDVGIHGSKYLFQVLSENGQHDLAYRIATQTTFPSFGYWLKQGATTMWENWKDSPEWTSLNHIMFGDIDAWFYKHLAGINYDPKNPGFKHIVIHPRPTGDLTWVKAEHQSPHGRIRSSWKIKNDIFSLDIAVPVNATATVFVPGTKITEGDSPAAQAKGVIFLRTEDDTSVFQVVSGKYQFASRLQPSPETKPNRKL